MRKFLQPSLGVLAFIFGTFVIHSLCLAGEMDAETLARIKSAKTSLQVFAIEESQWNASSRKDRKDLLRQEWKTLQKMFHPDLHVGSGNEDLAKKATAKINRAYEILVDGDPVTSLNQSYQSNERQDPFSAREHQQRAQQRARERQRQAEEAARQQEERIRRDAEAAELAQFQAELNRLKSVYNEYSLGYASEVLSVLAKLESGKLRVGAGAKELSRLTDQYIEAMDQEVVAKYASMRSVKALQIKYFEYAWLQVKNSKQNEGYRRDSRYLARPFEALSLWIRKVDSENFISIEHLDHVAKMTYGHAYLNLDSQIHKKSLNRIALNIDDNMFRHTGRSDWQKSVDWISSFQGEGFEPPQKTLSCAQKLMINAASNAMNTVSLIGGWEILKFLF